MRISILVLLLATAGCATQPVPDSDTTPVPRERVRHPAYLETAPGTGTLSVKRDPGFMGSGCRVQFFIDAIPVADIDPGERVVLHVPVGDHTLSVTDSGRGMCKLSNVPEVTAHISAEEASAFRIGAGYGGLAIGPTAF